MTNSTSFTHPGSPPTGDMDRLAASCSLGAVEGPWLPNECEGGPKTALIGANNPRPACGI